MTVIHGDCVEALTKLGSNTIDLTVTSPPYDDLRTYNDSSKWDYNVFKDVATLCPLSRPPTVDPPDVTPDVSGSLPVEDSLVTVRVGSKSTARVVALSLTDVLVPFALKYAVLVTPVEYEPDAVIVAVKKLLRHKI